MNTNYKTVCQKCSGVSLGRYIFKHGEKEECSYCKRTDYFVMQIEQILPRLYEAVRFYYESPEDYPSLEWNYYTSDAIDDEDLELTDAKEDFINDLKQVVDRDDKVWLRKGDIWTPFSKALKLSWDNFSNIVKTQWRYVYFLCENHIEDPTTYSPVDTMDLICEIIKSRPELTTELPAHTQIFRARKCDDKIKISAKSLGATPKEHAKSNRFSPEGISMFYGSFDKETPLKEVDGDSNRIIIGEFYNSISIKLLDLTQIPEDPKLYDDDYGFISPLRFLRNFVETISKKNDSKSNIEYIPTQVFIEYIRFQGLRNLSIKGIKYNSVQNKGSVNVVLFYTNNECKDEADCNENDDSLILKSYETKLFRHIT